MPTNVTDRSNFKPYKECFYIEFVLDEDNELYIQARFGCKSSEKSVLTQNLFQRLCVREAVRKQMWLKCYKAITGKKLKKNSSEIVPINFTEYRENIILDTNVLVGLCDDDDMDLVENFLLALKSKVYIDQDQYNEIMNLKYTGKKKKVKAAAKAVASIAELRSRKLLSIDVDPDDWKNKKVHFDEKIVSLMQGNRVKTKTGCSLVTFDRDLLLRCGLKGNDEFCYHYKKFLCHAWISGNIECFARNVTENTTTENVFRRIFKIERLLNNKLIP